MAPTNPRGRSRSDRLAWCAGLAALCASATLGAWVYPPYGAPPSGAPAQPPMGWGGPPPTQYQAQPPSRTQGESPPGGRPGAPAAEAAIPPAPGPGQFRPLPPGNARGTPPVAAPSGRPAAPYPGSPYPARGAPGGWPGAYGPGYPPGGAQPAPFQAPGGAFQPGTPAAGPVARLEWALDDTRPYVQQTVLLRLRLISAEALATADPELAARGDVLLEQVAGPTASTRVGADGGRELVTEFVFALTPLSPGDLELPAPRVSGTRAGTPGRYSAVAAAPVRLGVRPPMAAVQPWLPLRSLSLNVTLDRPERLVPGQPATLILEASGVGAGAAVLPSLGDQLKSPDFRIYPEQTLTETGLAADGRRLTGRRTEYYTLVPLGGGNLRLPELRVQWWNLDTEARQVAVLPMRTLDIAGADGPFRLPASLTAVTAGWGKALLPITGLLLLLAGYWAAVLWHRFPTGRRGRRSRRWSLDVRRWLRGLRAETSRLARRLAPGGRALAARVHEALPRMLPACTRLRLCLRRAVRASEPDTWCREFGAAADRLLGVSGLCDAHRLARVVCDACPRVDGGRLSAHLGRLERARYGREPLEFATWKRDLARLLRWRPGLPRWRPGRVGLPPLNPRPALDLAIGPRKA